MLPLHRVKLIVLLSIAFLTSACSTSMSVMSSDSDSHADSAPFRNFLVVGISDNYNNRAQYERTVVSLLKRRGVSATAYYNAVGGNKPVNKEAVRAVVDGSSYDAVLVTRVLGRSDDFEVTSGTVAAKVTRREGKPLDFFRYDYEELDEPGAIEVSSDVDIAIGLYSAADETLVLSFSISKKNVHNIGALIDDVAENVVQRLARDKRIAK